MYYHEPIRINTPTSIYIKSKLLAKERCEREKKREKEKEIRRDGHK